jgi:hypothetical protein
MPTDASYDFVRSVVLCYTLSEGITDFFKKEEILHADRMCRQYTPKNRIIK